jgi:exopolysaccharide production protein ExoZ
LYWLATIAFIGAAVMMPSKVFHTEMSTWFLISSFLFIPALSPAGLTVPVYSLGWTLNYEMFFYLIFGLCLLLPSLAKRLIAMSVAICGLVIMGQIAEPQGVIAATYTDPIMLEFLAGVLAGSVFKHLQGLRVPLLLGAGIMIASVVLFVGLLPFSVPRPVAFGLPALICVCGALLIEMSGPRRTFAIGRWLGDASYSIYLSHPFVLRPFFIASSLAVASPSGTTQIALVVFATLVGVAGGVCCYVVVERPLTAIISSLLIPARPARGPMV